MQNLLPSSNAMALVVHQNGKGEKRDKKKKKKKKKKEEEEEEGEEEEEEMKTEMKKKKMMMMMKMKMKKKKKKKKKEEEEENLLVTMVKMLSILIELSLNEMFVDHPSFPRHEICSGNENEAHSEIKPLFQSTHIGRFSLLEHLQFSHCNQ